MKNMSLVNPKIEDKFSEIRNLVKVKRTRLKLRYLEKLVNKEITNKYKALADLMLWGFVAGVVAGVLGVIVLFNLK